MLAGLAARARETWREITDEQDTVRRSVLRTRLVLVGMVIVVLALWLLIKLNEDQRGLLWNLIGVALYASLVVYVCWVVAIVVRRAQHRLASQGRSAGILRAAVWSVTKGDASIKLACLLTLLSLAELMTGPDELGTNPFWVVWIIGNLFIAGALPKDRYFAGASPQASIYRKTAWVLVGSISGLIVAVGLLRAQHCDCTLSDAAPLIIEPLFGAGLAFGFCLLIMNFSDPLARRRLNYNRTSAARGALVREGETSSRFSPR